MKGGDIVGNNIPLIPNVLSKKELLEKQYKQEHRELRIARTRAGMVRNQILSAYEILENIRFDYISDTMFRDYIVSSKRELEGAIIDFLLSDSYWENRIVKLRKMTPEEYNKELNQPIIQKGGKK